MAKKKIILSTEETIIRPIDNISVPSSPKIVLYDFNDNPLIREIGYKKEK